MTQAENKFRVPRIWSNEQLKKFAEHFEGKVINISAWKDEDKQGAHYKDYFKNASFYQISNYKKEARGFQGLENEIFLDLEEELPNKLIDSFDVAFNHTSLEHIFEFRKAFKNICKISRDIVIIVVPFLQEMHGDYGDFWRFTPLSMKRLFEENNMEMIYCDFNRHAIASTYIFCIGTKNSIRWKDKIPKEVNIGLSDFDKEKNVIGYNVIKRFNKKHTTGILKRLLDKFRGI